MRASIALRNLENNNIDEETRDFLIQKLSFKPLVKDDRYCSLRCPCCNTTKVTMFDKYCRQCGQRIEGKW